MNSTWRVTASLRWDNGILQQRWVRMDWIQEIAEGTPYQGAEEWRDVADKDADSG